MKHVLIGQDLGGNRGHNVRIQKIVNALPASVSVTVVCKAPTTTEHLRSPKWLVQGITGQPHTYGDVLYKLGLGKPGYFRSITDQWDTILAKVNPDLVIADFAPGLLSAAYGRIPTLTYGNGFDCPPGDMTEFPSLFGEPATFDEQETAEACGVEYLPQIFRADKVIVGAIPSFDPYSKYRDHVIPEPEGPLKGDGDETFVYWQGGMPKQLREYLRTKKVRYYANIDLGFGIRESEPVSWALIASRSCEVVSHGGAGFVTQALLSGFPQIVCPKDMEKRWYAEQVNGMTNCREAAVALRDKFTVSPVQAIVDYIQTL